MKTRQGIFFYFVVIATMVIITMVGCVGVPISQSPAFPSEFIGTWERAYQSPYTNTLTFTSNTLKDSSQNGYWKLTAVSGDAYTIAADKDANWKFTNTYKFVGGNLMIGGNTAGTDKDNWDGTWRKR